jgi:hypothetical protein
MFELLDKCTVGLKQLQQRYEQMKETGELDNVEQKKKDNPLRKIDGEMWKVEIDVENVNDIVKRIKNEMKPTMKEKLKSLMPSIF